MALRQAICMRTSCRYTERGQLSTMLNSGASCATTHSALNFPQRRPTWLGGVPIK